MFVTLKEPLLYLFILLASYMGFGCQSSRGLTDSPLGSPQVDRWTLYTWPEGIPDHSTKLNVRHTDLDILVRWECSDDYIATPQSGRDSDLYKGDVVELFIDPAGDGLSIVEIQVNPNNDILDLLLKFDAGRQLTERGRLTEASVQAHFSPDRKLNLDGLQTSAGRTPGGYWVEMVIPIQAIRDATGKADAKLKDMKWNLVRLDRRRDDRVVQTSLVQVEPGCQHISPDRTVAIFK